MLGACVVVGGMHSRGASMVGGYVLLGACVVGACIVGGHAWQGTCVAGGHVSQGACMPCTPRPDTTRYGRSMRGRYASYWNAFLFNFHALFDKE